jgi:predicted Zn-dependent protease
MIMRRQPMRAMPGYGSAYSSGGRGRLVVAIIMVAIALISYYSSRVYNPVTGENQHISITEKQEIALGLQAVQEMEQQYQGVYPDKKAQDLVDAVGFTVVKQSDAGKTDWPFEFTLLADPETINAFALPGGQVFITYALFSHLQTEGQLAGVLGHEVGHVVARHGAQRIAKSDLTQGLSGAVAVASGDARASQVAAMVAQLVTLKYGRDDELQADRLGVRFMSQAGYDPRAMIGVMQILAQLTAGKRPPEFFSTHPNPENRIQKIQAAIQEAYPNGVPAGLKP